jgi:hypothetical protein
MEVSVFLAKLIGLYLLAMGGLWIARGHVILLWVEEFDANRAAVFLGGLIALVAGLAMVIGHSVWEFGWRGLITLIGYASLIKGASLIAFPDWQRGSVEWMRNKVIGRIWLLAVLVLGGYLTWRGFAGP